MPTPQVFSIATCPDCHERLVARDRNVELRTMTGSPRHVPAYARTPPVWHCTQCGRDRARFE